MYITIPTHLTLCVFTLFPIISLCPYNSQHTSQYSYPSQHTSQCPYPSQHTSQYSYPSKTSQSSYPSQTSHSIYTLPNISQCSHPTNLSVHTLPNKPQCSHPSQFTLVFVTVLTRLTVCVFTLFLNTQQYSYPFQSTSQYSYPSQHTLRYSYLSQTPHSVHTLPNPSHIVREYRSKTNSVFNSLFGILFCIGSVSAV